MMGVSLQIEGVHPSVQANSHWLAGGTCLALAPAMINASQIKPNIPVVCSNNNQFAVVDHMEGTDTIKLNKDDKGQHHYIPLSWGEIGRHQSAYRSPRCSSDARMDQFAPNQPSVIASCSGPIG